MPLLLKKISIFILVLSLGWLPIEVAFATSSIVVSKSLFTASANSSKNSQIKQHHSRLTVNQGNIESQPNLLLDSTIKQASVEKTEPHCAMHEKGKDCCNDKSSCGQMDQDCGHCLHFVAMLHWQYQTDFHALYLTQSNDAYSLNGITNISAYRPPRI